eukprot:TRINITY_DN5743_c0_g2_i3.p3 TRINITY_DN5743_c0_g2~~TRINITY_DN5743_c0_g2_i3.p3  ORF type:complete len:185 (+),score=45.32 TRINITY_DN5743_c0_g2_i3:921-1475(+)
MELVPDGELFSMLEDSTPIPETQAALVMMQIGKAIEYLHCGVHVIHRDIKPENVLYSRKENAFKLTDFGTAIFFDGDEEIDDVIGTPGYVAPEVVLGEAYGASVDLWAMGVVLYMIFCKGQPFEHASLDEAYPEDLTVPFTESLWGAVDTQAKQLICNLLKEAPEERVDSKMLIQDPWVVRNSK